MRTLTSSARRPDERCRLRAFTRRATACALALCLMSVVPADAQCPLKARPRPGATGYQPRLDGCEGLYIQLQSAPINLQVVSLVRHALRVPEGDTAHVHVPANPESLRTPITIVGRGREANLNWALDGDARPGAPLRWLLKAVVRTVDLDAERLGIFGETRKANGLGGPIYVPVDVRGVREPYPGHAGAVPPPVELVLRIPGAGALEHRMSGTDWVRETPINGDGYFAIVIQSPEQGVRSVEIRWRPSDSLRPGPPESLSIFFW